MFILRFAIGNHCRSKTKKKAGGGKKNTVSGSPEEVRTPEGGARNKRDSDIHRVKKKRGKRGFKTLVCEGKTANSEKFGEGSDSVGLATGKKAEKGGDKDCRGEMCKERLNATDRGTRVKKGWSVRGDGFRMVLNQENPGCFQKKRKLKIFGSRGSTRETTPGPNSPGSQRFENYRIVGPNQSRNRENPGAQKKQPAFEEEKPVS